MEFRWLIVSRTLVRSNRLILRSFFVCSSLFACTKLFPVSDTAAPTFPFRSLYSWRWKQSHHRSVYNRWLPPKTTPCFAAESRGRWPRHFRALLSPTSSLVCSGTRRTPSNALDFCARDWCRFRRPLDAWEWRRRPQRRCRFGRPEMPWPSRTTRNRTRRSLFFFFLLLLFSSSEVSRVKVMTMISTTSFKNIPYIFPIRKRAFV